MSDFLGNRLEIGMVDGSEVPLVMTPKMRSMHLYMCGLTGAGKSKMLENLIRQDIAQWHNSKCGALILDPHGSLYSSLINWIAWNKRLLKDVPIVPIDLRQKDWTIAYNALRPRAVADPSVAVNNFVQAMAHVWGVDGTLGTPLFGRLAKEVLWPIYQKQMTLNEVKYLIDRTNKRLRTELTSGLTKDSATQGWEFANNLSPKDFNTQFSSTVNRFYNFLDTEKLKLMFGQSGASLDLGTALKEGQIIIVNLSTEGATISAEDASLFATLLLSDLWTAAGERGKAMEGREVKPFYVYVDEFQRFVTPTIAKNLDEARGFGLHLTLANQFPRQILHGGASGPQVFDSVIRNARTKIAFCLEGEEDLKVMAQALFMGVMNPDEIKLRMYSKKVMDFVEETRIVRSSSENWSDGTGDFTGQTDTASTGGSIFGGDQQDPQQWNSSSANSAGTSRTGMTGGSSGETEVPFLKPVFGEELSSIQYRGLDEQLFRAMATLFDQQERHGVVRLVGETKPVKIVTPTIETFPTTKEMTDSYLTGAYQKLTFALPSAEAQKQIDKREEAIESGATRDTEEDEIAVRRRIR